jgi:hypothetical protein
MLHNVKYLLASRPWLGKLIYSWTTIFPLMITSVGLFAFIAPHITEFSLNPQLLLPKDYTLMWD